MALSTRSSTFRRTLFMALLLWLVPLGTVTAQAAQDAPPTDGDRVIATVFEQEVTLDGLQLPPKVVESMRSRLSPQEFDRWLELQRSRVLSGLLFKVLSNSYMQENGITSSEEEIDQFLADERNAYNKVMNEYVAALRDYQHQAEEIFATGTPVPPELQAKIDELQKKIKQLERTSTDRMLFSDKQRQMQEEVRRQRASDSIRSWKFNKLLHEQFGGRVKTEKDSLTYVPYEAYVAWLQTQQKLGNFEITDPALNERFWALFTAEPENPIEPFDGMWDQLRWVGSNMP